MRRRLRQWLELWDEQDEAAGQAEAHPALESHPNALSPDGRATSVLVPLCGRGPDLARLAENGMQAVGVECSRRAIAGFASDHGYELSMGDGGGEDVSFTTWYAGPCTIFEGDWFEATPELLGGKFEAAFDHGALAVVEPKRRAVYATVLSAMLRPTARLIVIAPEFDESSCAPELTALGPHSLPLQELRELFPEFDAEVLFEAEVGAPPGGPPGADHPSPSGRKALGRLAAAANLGWVLERAVLLRREAPLYTPRPGQVPLWTPRGV
ncbi:unnamed protein product [Prorocentrum cordatum]|uniref:Thiopurine S-methyltransferase n=1 Tax=Prorocentrum cordatum TaxID=2364126 RepID=A0ABN9R651_9DINO|nr:unnamed protein product [Polarella glacialis]